MDVWGATICFNTVEAAKRNIPKPESWQDLTKPVYKGQIVMPNPASSGTGYLDVSSWIQIMGEANAWKFMDGLHENVAQYMHSGSRPCAAAAAGEYAVGISFEYRANREKAARRADRPRVPEGRAGLGPRGHGHHEDHDQARRREEARRLGDLGRRDGALRGQLRDHRRDFGVEAAAERARGLRQQARQERLRMGGRRTRSKILAEWSKRYDSKSAPK